MLSVRRSRALALAGNRVLDRNRRVFVFRKHGVDDDPDYRKELEADPEQRRVQRQGYWHPVDKYRDNQGRSQGGEGRPSVLPTAGSIALCALHFA